MLNAHAGGFDGDDDGDEGIVPWPFSFRHTKRQVLQLEEFYEEDTAYPTKKQMKELATKIHLHPIQVMYWFQNRRSQEKLKGNPASGPDGRTKRSEAYRKSTKASSGGDFDDEATNSDDLDVLYNNNNNGDEDFSTEMPVAQEAVPCPLVDVATTSTQGGVVYTPPVATISTQGVFATPPVLNEAPDQTRASDSPTILPEPTVQLSDEINQLLVDTAVNSMTEFLHLAQTNEPLWKPSTDGMSDYYLDIETYQNMFPKENSDLNKPNVRIEASRSSGLVMIDELVLANMFMDSNKWMQCFPTIVPEAEVIRVEASAGIEGNPVGTLQLMCQAIHFLSPLVHHREMYFLRYCQQIDQGLWAIVDVSWNPPTEEKQFYPIIRKLPSGCLIQSMRNGCTKVTWIEHVEVEDKSPIHPLFRDHILKGIAFGAGRWISTLQRITERLEFLPVIGVTNPADDQLVGVISSNTGRDNLMKLSQMMINNFFASICTSHSQNWNTLSRANDIQVRMSYGRNTEPIEVDSLIIGAATSTWLPLPPKEVFDYLRNETTRAQWDVLSFNYEINEIAYIVNGSEPGNRISVLEAVDSKGIKMLMLQESSTDPSGSLVVHSPITRNVLKSLTTEQDLSEIELLPSGMLIFPAGSLVTSIDGSSSSSNSSECGSFVTLGFQKILRDLPAKRLNVETIIRAENIIKTNVSQLINYYFIDIL